MNLDQLKGNWKQLQGKLKSEFGELTDDDLMKAEGEAENLAGIVQEKYGISKEKAEEKIDAFLKKNS